MDIKECVLLQVEGRVRNIITKNNEEEQMGEV